MTACNDFTESCKRPKNVFRNLTATGKSWQMSKIQQRVLTRHTNLNKQTIIHSPTMAKDHEPQKNPTTGDTGGENCPSSPKAAEKTTEAAELILAPLDCNVSSRLREIQPLFQAC